MRLECLSRAFLPWTLPNDDPNTRLNLSEESVSTCSCGNMFGLSDALCVSELHHTTLQSAAPIFPVNTNLRLFSGLQRRFSLAVRGCTSAVRVHGTSRQMTRRAIRLTSYWIRSEVIPTGDATTGMPTAIYWIALKAHLSPVHSASGKGVAIVREARIQSWIHEVIPQRPERSQTYTQS